MEESKKADLNISGYGTAAGGEYRTVRINGRCRITGDLACEDFRINGSGEVTGNADCASLHINGAGQVAGTLKAKELKVLGSADFGGDVSCESISVSGTAGFKSGLHADIVKITGSLRAKGDCNAERFVSSGLFEIDGLLNADHIEVNLDWSLSRAKEIGGADISVKPGAKGFGVLHSLFPPHTPRLEAETIEGNELSLAYTKAQVVRGNNVFLGDGCDIALVEYTGILRKSGSAVVGEERKV